MNGLALCAGIGGLELGIHLAVGDTYRTVCHVEREAYAAASLVARMEDETLDRAPVWDDLETFDGRPWCGKVDIVSAGFPCQPFSNAGKRRGTSDERWLWKDIARILGEVRPRYVFLENVRGILTPAQRDALGAVLGTLADLGYDAEWDVFSAAEVGASHRRERFFLLGHADQPRLEGRRKSVRVRCDEWATRTAGPPLGEAAGNGAKSPWPPGPGCGPEDWPESEPQPAVRREADGLPAELVDRTDRLRSLGNGVVPLVAAHAFRTLANRILREHHEGLTWV